MNAHRVLNLAVLMLFALSLVSPLAYAVSYSGAPRGGGDDLLSPEGWARIRGTGEMWRVLDEVVARGGEKYDPVVERYFWEHVVPGEWFNGYYTRLLVEELIPSRKYYYDAFFHLIISNGFYRYVAGTSGEEPLVGRDAFLYYYTLLFYRLIPMNTSGGYYYETVLGDLALNDVWGYGDIVYYLVEHDEVIGRFYALAMLSVAAGKAVEGEASPLFTATGDGRGGVSAYSGSRGRLVLSVASVNGEPLSGLAEIRSIGGGGGGVIEGIPWAAPARSQRVIVTVSSQFDRLDYPTPIRINFTELNEAGHVDGSTLEVYMYDPDTGMNRALNYSAVEVGYNTYWFVVEANLSSTRPNYIVIYYDYGGAYSPGVYYGGYQVRFPLPVDPSGGYEQAHVQLDKEVPRGSGYGDNMYILLLAPKGYLFPVNDTEAGSGHWLSDDSYYSSSIPFPFPISTLYIGSNGIASPVYGITDWSDTLNELISYPAIAVLWDDLKDYSGSTVYEYTGVWRGLQYKTWYWKTGYYSDGYDGRVRFRFYLVEDGTIGIHYYDFVPKESRSWSPGFTTGISDSQGRWISPISSSSGRYALFSSETETLSYDMVYVKLDTLSYNVSLGGRGHLNRDGVYYRPIVNGSLVAELVPGDYEVVLRGGVYGYVGIVHIYPGANTSLSLVAYPVSVGFTDSSGYPIGFLAVELYAGPYTGYIDTVYTNSSGYLDAYFLEGTYTVHPLLMPSGNPYLSFTVSSTSSYPATYTYQLNVSRIVINIDSNASTGYYGVAIYSYRTGSPVKHVNVSAASGAAEVFLAPGRYRVVVETYSPGVYMGAATAYETIRIGVDSVVDVELGEAASVSYTFPALRISYGGGPLPLHLYMVIKLPGGEWVIDKGYIVTNTWYPVEPGEYMAVPDTLLPETPLCNASEWSINVTVGESDTEAVYEAPVEPGYLVIDLGFNSTILYAETVEVYGETVCGAPYHIEWSPGAPLPLLPGNYTVYAPSILQAPWEAASISITSGSTATVSIPVGRLVARVIGYGGEPVAGARLVVTRNSSGWSISLTTSRDGAASTYLYPGNYTVTLIGYDKRYVWGGISVEGFNETRATLLLDDAEQEIGYGLGRLVVAMDAYGGRLAIDYINVYAQLDANGSRGDHVATIALSEEYQDTWLDLAPGLYIVEACSGGTPIYTVYNVSITEGAVTTVEIPLVYLHVSVRSSGLPVLGAPVFIDLGGHVLGVWTTMGSGDVYVATVPGHYVVYTYTAGGEDFSYAYIDASVPGETYNASLTVTAGVIHVVVRHNDTGLPGVPVSVSGYVVETDASGEAYVAVYPRNYTVLLPYNGVSSRIVEVAAADTVTLVFNLSRLTIRGPLPGEAVDGTVLVRLYVENDAGTHTVSRSLALSGETWFYVEDGSYTIAVLGDGWSRVYGVTVSGNTVFTAPLALISIHVESKYPVNPFDVIISGEEAFRETLFIDKPLGEETIYRVVPPGTYSVRIAGLYYGDTGNIAGYGDSAGPYTLTAGDVWDVGFNLSGIGIIGNASCGLVRVYAYIDGELVYYASIDTSGGSGYIGLTRGYYVVELPNGARSNVLYVDGVRIIVLTCYNVTVAVHGPFGEPVEDAHILVKNNAGTTIYDLYTGPDGRVSFALINGSYRIVLPGTQYSYDPYMASIDRYSLLGYGAEYTLTVPAPNNTVEITLHRIDVATLIGDTGVDDVLLVLYTSDNRIVGGRLTLNGSASFYVTPGVYKLYIRGVAYAYGSYQYLGIPGNAYLAGGGAFLGLLDVSAANYTHLEYTGLSLIRLDPVLLNASRISYGYRLLYGTGNGYTVFAEGSSTGVVEAIVTPGAYRSEVTPPDPSPAAIHTYTVPAATVYIDKYYFTIINASATLPSYPGSPYTGVEARIYRGYEGASSPGQLVWSGVLGAATVYLEAGPVYGVIVPGPMSDGTDPGEGYGYGYAVVVNSTEAVLFNIVFDMALVVINVSSASGPVQGLRVGLLVPGHGALFTETGSGGLGFLLVTRGVYGFVAPTVYSGVLGTVNASGGVVVYSYVLGEVYVSMRAPEGLVYGNDAATLYVYDDNDVAVASSPVSLGAAARLLLAVNRSYRLEFSHQYGVIEPVALNVSGPALTVTIDLGALVSSVAYLNGTLVECGARCLHRVLYAVTGQGLVYLYDIYDNNASIALAPGTYRIVYSSDELGGVDTVNVYVGRGNITWHTYRLALLNISVAASVTGEPISGAGIEVYSLDTGRVVAVASTNTSGLYAVQVYGGRYRVRVSTPGGYVVRETVIEAAAGIVNNVSFTIEYADVEVSSVTATPDTPSDGDTIYLYITITNNGPSHITHDFTVKAYVNDTLASEATVHGLLAGTNTTLIITLTAVAGLMMITVVVDEEQTFFDENRGNNRYSLNITVEKPDLAISGVSVTPPERDGEAGVVAVNITNNGPGSIHRVVYVEIIVNGVKATRVVNGLDAGSTATVSASLTMSSGVNEIRVVVDPRDEIREVREDNNEYATTYTLPYVDLEVSITGFAYTELVEGEVARLTYVVRNNGYGTARTFYVNIYVDGSLVLTEPIHGLGSGEEKELAYLHEILGGKHVITVIVDPQGVVPENNTGNNNASYTYDAPQPDLVISGARPSSYILDYGEPLSIAINVTNTGYSTRRTFYVHVYIDGEYYNITSFFGGIPGGETLTGTLLVTGIPDGNHTVEIMVDPENRVHELDEDNNRYVFNITVLASDIEIAGYTVNNTNTSAGDTVALTVTIRNNGPGAVMDTFYVSLFVNGEYVEQRPIHGLGVGDAVEMLFTVTVDAGTVNVTVVADDHYERTIAGYTIHGHHHEVGDPDRGNNVLTVMLYGKAVDYCIESVELETGIPAWGQPSARLRVVNKGNLTAMGNIVLSISVDSIGFRNTYIYPLPHPLGPGNHVDIVVPQEYMPMLPPGTWSIVFTVDPYNGVAEEDENNNAAVASLTVDYPDLAIVSVAADPSSGVLDEGDEVNLTITFANYGNTVLYPFCLRVVDSAGRTLYRTLLVNISGGYTGSIKASINITPPGGANYYVVIDYYDDIPESNEDNNIYQLTLPLVRSIDIVYPTLRLWYNRSSTEKLVIVNNGGVDTVLSQVFFNVSWITASYTPGTVIEAGKALEIPLTIDTVAAGLGQHPVLVTVKLDGAVAEKTLTVTIMRAEETVRGIEEVPSEINATVEEDNAIELSLTWPAEYNVSLILGGNASVFFTDRVLNLSGGAALGIELPYSLDGAAPGTYVLYIAVYAPGLGVIVNRSVTIVVRDKIELTMHAPGNNTEVSTSALTIVFETTPATNATVYVTDTATNETIVVTDPVTRTLHVYRLGGLAYYHTYRVVVAVSTPYRTLWSKPYYVSINPNAAVFLEHSLTLRVRRDYDQRFTVTIVNNDPYYSHRVTAWVINPYSDLIIGFTGPGSSDAPLALAPGASAQLTLVVHTQDAERSNYTVYAVLLDLDTGRRDVAEISIVVEEPVFNITITHLWTNNYTLVQAYMITNHGDTITDLRVLLTGPAASYSYIYPAVNHGRLEKGHSMIIYVVPSIPAMPDEVWRSLQVGLGSGVLTVLTPDLGCGGGGAGASAPVSVTPPPGTRPYGVNHPGAELGGEAADWYCTNRPVVETTIPISHDPPAGSYEAYLFIDFHPYSDVRPHDVDIYVNGHLVYTLTNTVPSGTVVVEVPYEYLGIDPSGGVSYVRVKIVSRHMNGGHYVVATNFRLLVLINKPTPFYVFAHSYEEAVGAFSCRSCLGVLAGILSTNSSYVNPAKKPKDEGCTDADLRRKAYLLIYGTAPGQFEFSFEKKYQDWEIGLEVTMQYNGHVNTTSLEVEKTYGGGGKFHVSVGAIKVEVGAEGSVTVKYGPNREKCDYECLQKTTNIKVLPSSYTYTIGPEKLLRYLQKIPYVDKFISRIIKWVKKYVEAEAVVEIGIKDITITINEDCRTGEKQVSFGFGLVTFTLKGIFKADKVAEVEVWGQGSFGLTANNKHLYLTIQGEIGAKGAISFGWLKVGFSDKWSPPPAEFQILGVTGSVYDIAYVYHAIAEAAERVAAEAFADTIAAAAEESRIGILGEANYTLATITGYDKSVLGENVFSDNMYNATIAGYRVLATGSGYYVVAAAVYTGGSSTIVIYHGYDNGSWSRVAAVPVNGTIVSIDAAAAGDYIHVAYTVYRGGFTESFETLLEQADSMNSVYYIGYNATANTTTEPLLLAENTSRDIAVVANATAAWVYWVVHGDSIDYVAAAVIRSGGVAASAALASTYTSERIVGVDRCPGEGIIVYRYTNASNTSATRVILYGVDGTPAAHMLVPGYMAGHAVAVNDTAIYVALSMSDGETWLVRLADGNATLVKTSVRGYVDSIAVYGSRIAMAYHVPVDAPWFDNDVYAALINPVDGDASSILPVAVGDEYAEEAPCIAVDSGAGYVFYLKGLLDKEPLDNTTYGYALAYTRIGGPRVASVAVDPGAPYEPGALRVTLVNDEAVNYTATLVVELDGVAVANRSITVAGGSRLTVTIPVSLPGPGRHVYRVYLARVTPSVVSLEGGGYAFIELPELLSIASPAPRAVYNASYIPLRAVASLSRYNATLFVYIERPGGVSYLGVYSVTPGNSTVETVLDLSGVVDNDTYASIVVGMLRSDGKAYPVELTVPVDVVPPRISLRGYRNGTPVAGVVELPITVYDVFLDPYATRVTVNGTPVNYTVVTGGGGYAEYRVVLNTTMYPSGKPLILGVYAVDRSGKRSYAEYVLVPYNEAPFVEIGLVNGSIVGANVSLTVNVTGLYLDSVAVYINDTLAYSGPANASQTVGIVFPGTGYYVVRIVVNNTLGYVSEERVIIYSDQEPPVLGIELANPYVSTSLGIDVDASDISGVTLYYAVDNASQLILLGPPGNYTIDAGGLDEGVHVLFIKAVDRFGNAAVAKREFVVDKTPPLITGVSLANNSYVSGNLTISFNATDPYLAGTSIYVNDTLYASNSTSATIDTRLLPDGRYVVEIVAVDMAGNTRAERLVVTIDNTPPYAEITGISNGTVVEGSAVTITLRYYDENIYRAVLVVDNKSIVLMGVYEKTVTLNLTPGWHTITLRVTDRAGNNATATITIQVTRPSPTAPAHPAPETPLTPLILLLAVAATLLYRLRRRN